MTTAQENVDRLRDTIDSKGISAGAKFLKSIFDPKDISLMLPLLLMRADKDQGEDEMWLIIKTVQQYPRAARLDVILPNLNAICKDSSWLLQVMLMHMLNDDEPSAQLVAAFKRRAPLPVYKYVVGLFKAIEKGDHEDAAKEILATLQVVQEAPAIPDVKQAQRTPKPSIKSPRTLSPAEVKVDELRKVIDEKGMSAGAKFLKKIFDPQDFSLMLPLLLMRADKDQGEDEMWLIIEMIEKYPLVPSLQILLPNLGQICANSGGRLGGLLHVFLSGIFNDDAASVDLVAAFKRAAPVRVNQCVVDLFQKMKSMPTHRKAINQILATIQVVQDVPAVPDVQQAKKAPKPSTKSSRKLSPAEKKVDELRKIIDDKGLEEGEEHLGEMLNLKDPSMILPLMLMREYGEYNSHHDEVWTVLHAIEGYPKEALVSTIVDNLNVLAEKSSELLDLMLLRISNTADYRKCLLDYIKKHPPTKANPEVTEVLEKARKSLLDEPGRAEFFEKVIKAIKPRKG